MIPSDMIDRARAVRIEDETARRGIKLVGKVDRCGPCPVCGGHDRFGVNTKKQLWNCRGCGKGGDVIALVRFLDGCDFREAVECLTGERASVPRQAREPPPAKIIATDDREARALMSAKQIVSEMVPILGTPGERYLRDVRKIDTSAIADVLERADAIGWHPAVYFNEPDHAQHGRKLGAIIAIMTDALTAEPTGSISRTYLAPHSVKIGKAKTLGSPMGIVRLTPDDEVLEGLHLAEGIETALAGMSIGLRPMWSTGSSGLMANFPVLAGVEAITVVVDHDLSGAGERAAREAEARWLAAGREVNLFRYDAPGDFNDALRETAR
jgi:Toprim domain/CHC2 zinc finger